MAGFVCHVAELPWRENRPNVSRIPAGWYDCVPRISAKYGRHFHVQDVPDRSMILIHSGNWAGDTSKGLRSHTHGCILAGRYAGVLDGQAAVLASRAALSDLLAALDDQSFTLRIEEAFGHA
ncbi:hypothetical protein PCS_02611 [Desulfocurvibacter africanus PCS]|uniref:DUF5675 domain-containing protein n=2 Tax=Desulfocurvibacter africanus TaxID=873 RepID=M5PR49_DESAF|nr:hypothetical protein PCS_02611 [Desulfocurvibacter africanus PCS]